MGNRASSSLVTRTKKGSFRQGAVFFCDCTQGSAITLKDELGQNYDRLKLLCESGMILRKTHSKSYENVNAWLVKGK